MKSHRNRSILLWLAALAILWGVLAPSLAASVVHGGKTWIEVCMSVGTRLVALDADGAADSQATYPGMHCPACVSQYGLAVAAHPPCTLILAGAPALHSVRFHERALPRPANYRTAHHSRAPPTTP